MSLYDYNASKEIALEDPPFYALIMAAMRRADTRNADLLRRAFPETWDELQARYNAPGGILPSDGDLSNLVGRVDETSPMRNPLGGALGHCPHGVNLDHDFCPAGCRV